MVPATAGMIVISYNIPGVTSEIKLPRDVYVDIFSGAIRRWDDPRIKAANPGISFPPREIVIVARQDGSGTTAAFTRHLDAVGPAWRQYGMQVGNLIDWPNGTTLVLGNEGVASKIPSHRRLDRLRRVLVCPAAGIADGRAAKQSGQVHHPHAARG